jgi:hypothetical protein
MNTHLTEAHPFSNIMEQFTRYLLKIREYAWEPFFHKSLHVLKLKRASYSLFAHISERARKTLLSQEFTRSEN